MTISRPNFRDWIGPTNNIGYKMGTSLILFCQLLLVGLVGVLGYIGVSSTVAWLGFCVFVLVMGLLIARRKGPETSLSPGRRAQ
jgi:UPF0716 family protein affecting phage T7 exclusion